MPAWHCTSLRPTEGARPDPGGLTLERALELTRDAFHEAGITLDGSIEIEAYPNACGVLVFARVPGPGASFGFSFDSLDPLLSAARALPVPRRHAQLLWWEGRYWLSLPAGADQAAAQLSEFGRSEDGRPHLEARLAEHGRPVLSGDALGALLTYFPV